MALWTRRDLGQTLWMSSTLSDNIGSLSSDEWFTRKKVVEKAIL